MFYLFRHGESKTNENELKENEAEQDFTKIFDIAKKYDKTGFSNLMDAVEKAWEGYGLMHKTKTRQEKDDDKQEKENKDITDVENSLIEI